MWEGRRRRDSRGCSWRGRRAVEESRGGCIEPMGRGRRVAGAMAQDGVGGGERRALRALDAPNEPVLVSRNLPSRSTLDGGLYAMLCSIAKDRLPG